MLFDESDPEDDDPEKELDLDEPLCEDESLSLLSSPSTLSNSSSFNSSDIILRLATKRAQIITRRDTLTPAAMAAVLDPPFSSGVIVSSVAGGVGDGLGFAPVSGGLDSSSPLEG